MSTRRYAMSHNRHGWAVHIRSKSPGLSLCQVALQQNDFPASTSTEICRNCLRVAAGRKR